MKKLFSIAVVALCAALTFTSCDPTEKMTPQELTDAIIKQGMYIGSDSDGDALSMTFTSGGFSLLYDAPLTYGFTGKWSVTSSDNFVLSDIVDTDLDELVDITGSIAKKGKELTFEAAGVTINVAAK